MIWQNAWAWLGLLTLALPLLIHLLSRRRARVQPFPTLRFLPITRLQPARSTRITDPWLLAVRLAILAAAASALAQPLFPTAQRRRSLERTLARVLVVDTSRSMQRSSSSGEPAVVVARRVARQSAAQAATSVIIETADVADVLRGAAAWLDTQPGRRELILISDFQNGTLEQSDLAQIPAGVGVQLQPVELAGNAAPLEVTTRMVDRDVVARVALNSENTEVEWTVRPRSEQNGGPWRTLAGAAEQSAARAAEAAAWSVSGKPEPNGERSIAFVHPQYETRAQLLRNAQPLNQAWMADLLLRIQRDTLLNTAALAATSAADSATGDQLIALARNERGQPVVLAARGQLDGRNALLLFSQSDAGSLASAALLAATARALSPSTQGSELEPASVPESVLQQWQRPAIPVARPVAERHTGASDGRWLWLAVLVLLGLESWLRRQRRYTEAAAATEVARERVA